MIRATASDVRDDIMRRLGTEPSAPSVPSPRVPRPRAAAIVDPEAGTGRAVRQQVISREKSIATREIGKPPPVVNPERRARGLASLEFFCRTYRPHVFFLPFSDDHREVIAALEEIIEHGGQRAVGMMRGGGKTQLCISALEWAILRGRRKRCMIITAAEGAAEKILSNKREDCGLRYDFECGVELGEDFPEVSHPIRRLEGINLRTSGQIIDGQRTMIMWSDDDVVFPTYTGPIVDLEGNVIQQGSSCSGALLSTRGLTGAIRGARRDLILLDDPQTRESAKSVTQTRDRMSTINGDVMELGGRQVKPAVMMTCTVIYENDLADQYLDRNKNPSWRGRKMPMVYAFPTCTALWDEYAKVRRQDLRDGGTGSKATAHYAANREAMDAGAKLGWPQSHQEGDLSALQSAMNFKIDRPAEFAAEAQLTPINDALNANLRELVADEVMRKVNRCPRWQVPRDCYLLTAQIDVHANVLYYAIVGWTQHFGGAVIDYGTFPKQGRDYFGQNDVSPSLADLWPNDPEDVRIFKGLMTLTYGVEFGHDPGNIPLKQFLPDPRNPQVGRWLVPGILSRPYGQQETGKPLPVNRCLVDCGYAMTAVIDFCRKSPHKSILLPSRGWGITAARASVGEWAKREGQWSGKDWMITAPASQRGVVVNVDANAWKSFARMRLAAALGERDSVNLFGEEAHAHQMFADHCTAEYRDPKPGRGRIVEEWKQKPARENHLWDCFYGCCVGASVYGLHWDPGAHAAGNAQQQTQPRKKIDVREQKADAERRQAAREAQQRGMPAFNKPFEGM